MGGDRGIPGNTDMVRLLYFCSMNWNYQALLPEEFSADSRVWVYQANRLFSLSEALEIETLLEGFIEKWQSHGDPVKGFGQLFFGQFLVLMADESQTGVSGCSTDSSVRFLKMLEEKFSIQLFDRQSLAFVIKDKVQLIPLSQLAYAVQHGFINGDTVFFNNLVQTKRELHSQWMQPAKNSWLARRVDFGNTVSSPSV